MDPADTGFGADVYEDKVIRRPLVNLSLNIVPSGTAQLRYDQIKQA